MHRCFSLIAIAGLANVRHFRQIIRACKTSNTRVMHRKGSEGPLVNIACRPMPSSGDGALLQLNTNVPRQAGMT